MTKNDSWKPRLYEKKQDYQFKYGEYLIDTLLKPTKGETILDLGCGTGQLTKYIADKGCEAVGCDISEAMVKQSKENYPNLLFEIKDAKNFVFEKKFDAIFSNAVLQWVKEADKAVYSISNNLKKDGRFVAQFGEKTGLKNIFSAANESHYEIFGKPRKHIYYFPTIGEYSSLLEKFRLEVISATTVDHMTALKDGKEGLKIWLQTFFHGIFPETDEETLGKLIPVMENKLKNALFFDDCWHIDYKRLQIKAIKK